MSLLLSLLVAAAMLAAGYALGVAVTRKAAQASQLQAHDAAVRAEARLDAERQAHDEALQRLQQLLKQQAEQLRQEFRSISAEALRSQGEGLRREHLHSLEALLSPLEKDIDAFRTQFVTSHSDFRLHMARLTERTESLGLEAENLAKALKGNNKLQGNWGEAVLDNLLAASGLTEGRDYSLQRHIDNRQGGAAIPDVIVHLPEGRNLVVDAKASLTAYTDYVAATDEDQRARLLKEHVRSLSQHVKELAAKNYAALVDGHIGYVLMFVPGEAPYMAAVCADPTLTTEAYRRHVIIVNPTNLLMALQLAYHLWQSERQQQSVHEIYEAAEKLYRKFATFAQNFVKIGNGLTQLQKTYDEAEKQLHTGRGNIVARLEAWRTKGMTTSASLPPQLASDEE